MDKPPPSVPGPEPRRSWNRKRIVNVVILTLLVILGIAIVLTLITPHFGVFSNIIPNI